MAVTSKKINLSQLDKELGGYGLNADFNDPKKQLILATENSPVTEEELEAGISNHVAGQTQEEVTQLNREQGLAKLKELGFTDEQIKALLNS